MKDTNLKGSKFGMIKLEKLMDIFNSCVPEREEENIETISIEEYLAKKRGE